MNIQKPKKTSFKHGEKIQDIQCIDWDTSNNSFFGTRSDFRHLLTSHFRDFYNVLTTRPNHKSYTFVELERLVIPRSFYKVPQIANNHFQLHYSFEVLSPTKYIHTVKDGISIFDVALQTGEKVAKGDCIYSFDVYGEILAYGCESDLFIKSLAKEEEELNASTKLTLEENIVNHVEFLNSRTGAVQLMVGGNSKNINIFDMEQLEKPITTLEVSHYVNHFSINPRNESLVMVALDATDCELYDLRTCQRTHQLEGHFDFSFSCDWRTDDNTVASGNQDCSAKIWDLRTGTSTLTIPSVRHAVGRVQFLESSNLLFLGEIANFMSFYDLQEYGITQTIDYFGLLVGLAEINRSGKIAVAVSDIYEELQGAGVIEIDTVKRPYNS